MSYYHHWRSIRIRAGSHEEYHHGLCVIHVCGAHLRSCVTEKKKRNNIINVCWYHQTENAFERRSHRSIRTCWEVQRVMCTVITFYCAVILVLL